MLISTMIDNLPNEILMIILGFLSISDIWSVRLVSVKFAMLSFDNVLWKHLIKRDNYNSPLVLRIDGVQISIRLPDERWEECYYRRANKKREHSNRLKSLYSLTMAGKAANPTESSFT